MSDYLLDYADVTWRDPVTPFSSRYGDIYWSSGLEEKQHVFIDGNDIPRRLQRLSPGEIFVVGEIGFGFGLNFLLTLLSWRKFAGEGRRLHYFAVERHPVHPGQLAELYTHLLAPSEALPEPDADLLNEYAQRLLTQYPWPTHGSHSRWLDRDICLTLVLDNVTAALARQRISADAWYLDGFNPTANDDIWNAEVYRLLAYKTLPGGTLSSYTAAGHVRRGLTTAGFQVRRQTGFGQKAEMITASFDANTRLRQHPATPSGVAIIGAGLAGLFCAKALALRNVATTVFEAGEQPLGGASAVRQMAVYPQLALQAGHWNHFSLAAFQHVCAMEPALAETGFNLIAENEAQQDRLKRLADFFPDEFLEYGDGERLAAVTGLPTSHSGLMYHLAGWLDMERAFSPLLERVDLKTTVQVEAIKRIDAGWELTGSDNETIAEASHVIIATGAAPMDILASLPLSPVRGQSISLRLPTQYQPRSILAGPVTLFPGKNGLSTLSATYDSNNTDTTVRDGDSLDLLGKLQGVLPGLTPEIESATVGLRNVSRDRVPVVGPVPDWRALSTWKKQRHGPHAVFNHHLPGLYVCTGFGSHGATHARLCAEYLAGLICGEPPVINEDWIRLLAPERFQLRDG